MRGRQEVTSGAETDSESSPLRVAFVGHRSMPSNYGGVEIYAEAVGAGLVQRGHQVLSFASAGEDPTQLSHRGIGLRATGRMDGKHIGALSQAFLSTIAAGRSGAHIVHFMAMGPTIFAPLVRLLSPGTAIVVTVAGRDDQRRKWGWLAKKLMKVCFRFCTRIPDQIIAVSADLAEELRSQTNIPVVAIPNGVSIPDGPTPGVKLPVSGNRPFVLYAGRLVPEKRVEVLVRSFDDVDQGVDLVIAGAGPEAYCTKLQKLRENDHRIQWIGHRSSEEIDLLMRSAELFVLPSELEGMPIALLEAVGRGLPVVVSDLPCNREVVGEYSVGARLVEVGNQTALSQAIQSTLSELPRARARAAYLSQHVQGTHRWEAVAQAVEDVYRSALVARSHPGVDCRRTTSRTRRRPGRRSMLSLRAR